MNNYKLPVNYTKLSPYARRKVREQYMREQKGKCAHCGNFLSAQPTKEIREKSINESLFPRGFFDYPVHLHHNHKTGMTIGTIHAKCNAVLWQYHKE